LLHSTITAPLPATIGPARLGRDFENRNGLSELVDKLLDRISGDSVDPGAMLDLSFLTQFIGNREQGLSLQAQAIALRQVFEAVYGDGSGLRVLALLAPGDLTANTPLDFLLENSNVTLLTAYLDLDAAAPLDIDVPDHDIAIMAVSESPENTPMLSRLADAWARWPRPTINRNAGNIARLTRDAVAAAFAGETAILAPDTRQLTRAQIVDADLHFPVTIRPTGTQAGAGLEKITSRARLIDYLSRYAEPEFYVADFVDYSGPDGLYRKQRIVLIDRVPYISHLAVSEDWIVHYMSAGMTKFAERRAEEAAFMQNFDDFVRRHAPAFELLCERIDLDYFGIDCGETSDGRLLLFEADVAMIVHSMEDGAEFAYKKPHMARLFGAFTDLLQRRARSEPQ
jgi:hypothetical protein